jgi:hypothetical protein
MIRDSCPARVLQFPSEGGATGRCGEANHRRSSAPSLRQPSVVHGCRIPASLALLLPSIWVSLLLSGPDHASIGELRTLQASDSGTSCPAGYARAIFLETFHGDHRAIDSLFPPGVTARLDSTGSRFRAPDLRRRLARLTGRPAADFAGSGAVCAFYSTSFTTSLLTEDGDGLAISIAPQSSSYVTTMCVIRDSVPSGSSFTQRLRDRDILLMRIMLGGEPHVVALRTLTLPRDQLKREQHEFTRTAAAATRPAAVGLFPGKPQDRVARCLMDASPARDSEGQH